MLKWSISLFIAIVLYVLDVISAETYWLVVFIILIGITIVSEVYELLKETKR